MDGLGRGAGDEADAVAIAATPTLDRLWVPGARAELCAHGKAVGLPSDDDMGNSEVGHNALGAGKVYAQGAVLVGRAIRSGALFEGETWQHVVARGVDGSASQNLNVTQTYDLWKIDEHSGHRTRLAQDVSCDATRMARRRARQEPAPDRTNGVRAQEGRQADRSAVAGATPRSRPVRR